MVDKWSMMRLVSVHNNVGDIFESLKENLLRYGFLIKANLPHEFSRTVIGVDYGFSKMNEPYVILHFDLTDPSYIGSVTEYYDNMVKIVGEDKISIYEYTDTDLIMNILI